MPELIGVLLNGRYRLEADLGGGGMGRVYSAHDTLLDRHVAVKVLSASALGAEGRARLLREAQAAAGLNHPNIVSVYDAGEAEVPGSVGTVPFIVMELVEGDSLRASPPVSLEEIVDVACQICAALEHAHASGVVHRDLKPENVLLLPDGTAKLVDFGLARTAASRLTAEGTILGTVYYIAPEQALGQEIDGRTDLYALGITLYEWTAGQLPYEGDDPVALIGQHLHAPVVPPREHNPEMAPALDALIVQLMSKRPEDRPASAAEVQQVLEALLQEPPAKEVPLERPRQPDFLTGTEERMVERPVFVARERELARLDHFLEGALAGQGQVVFVTGGPGRGKTALLAEFARRAMRQHPSLLAASGNCNAYSGVGDPYLPFREVLDMLTGDVEGRWASGLIASDHARRLWSALPQTVQALLDHGPHVAPALVSGKGLLTRATAAAPEGAPWLQLLEGQVARQAAAAEGLEQSHLFQQVTNVLRSLAQAYPLLLIMDDLQWVDTASVGLLFHLGRRLDGARILIVGTYRPVEVALGRGGERHPLEKLLGEFKRTYGDAWLDLADVEEPEQRRFVDALLETEPNCLGEGFRRALTEHTGGHPLFTVELLEAMQRRGDLIRDEAGHWTQALVLDWETLPARVEGVIEERVGRLEPELREILSVASVEGETFTVPVLAQVQGMKERQLLRRLAQELERRHGLVLEQADVQIGPRRFCRFKFGHTLVQNYLYQQLGQAERRLLHTDVAAALENCYGEQADEFAVQLAHHYYSAGDDRQALSWFTQAAENASRVHANDEAYAHYTRALELAQRVSVDPASVIRLYLGHGLVCQTLGDFEGALADYESALHLARSAGEDNVEHLEWRALVDLGRLWTARDYSCAHDRFQDALELAHHLGDPSLLAGSLNWMGNWYLNQENPQAAIEHHQEALGIFEQVGDRRNLATTLDLLGIANLHVADLAASVAYYDRAIVLFRELGDLPTLASSLTGRGHSGLWKRTVPALVPSTVPSHPRRDLEEAIRISREIGSPDGEAWALWSVGLLRIVHGQYGQALEAAVGGLQIATQIEHREGMAASRCVLGFLYAELLTPARARQHLEVALTLAEELHNRVLILWATGALAAAYCLLDDVAHAQACLETVLSAETPMDTLYKRYCWAMRAELALCHGDPTLALDIVGRLIASAPGMSPGRVITFLWKVKGEALAAMGQMEQAHTMLQEAVENAHATGERFLLWRLHASLGWLCLAMGRHSEADKELSTARELTEELANTVPDGELRDSFLQRAHKRLVASP